MIFHWNILWLFNLAPFLHWGRRCLWYNRLQYLQRKWTLVLHMYRYTHHDVLIFGASTRQKSRWSREDPHFLNFISQWFLILWLSLCANLYFKQVRFKFLFPSILCGWSSSSFHFLQQQYGHVAWHMVHESVCFMYIFQKVSVRRCTRCVALQG